MGCRDNSDWTSVLAVVVGLTAAFVTQAAVVFSTVWLIGQTGSIVAPAAVVFLGGVCAGPFLCTFYLTRALPRASDVSLICGCAFAYAVGETASALLVGPAGVAVCLVVVPISIGTACLGVRVARPLADFRRSGPAREPQCPKCGYVLYFAGNQICPDCGRPFGLPEVDMRRAHWDGFVLRPMAVTQKQ